MPATTTNADRTRWWRRLAWFAALWLAGVGAVAVVAWLLRLALRGSA